MKRHYYSKVVKAKTNFYLEIKMERVKKKKYIQIYTIFFPKVVKLKPILVGIHFKWLCKAYQHKRGIGKLSSDSRLVCCVSFHTHALGKGMNMFLLSTYIWIKQYKLNSLALGSKQYKNENRILICGERHNKLLTKWNGNSHLKKNCSPKNDFLFDPFFK